VNVFERGSAGGHRLEMKAHDSRLGIEVLFECENGTYRQQRQLVFVEKGGSTKHLPIREGTTSEQLRTEYQRLGVNRPCDVHTVYDPATEQWVETLLKEVFPSATFGEGNIAGTSYQRAVVDIRVTNRYFRAVAKIGFHYFLTQFPEYAGHEPRFSEIRQFIMESSGDVDRANEFIGKREHALLAEMLTPGVHPDGWRAHVLCAETKPGECVAYVQMFVSEDWAAPIYAVRLAPDAALVDCRATGHAYMYYENGHEGKFAGEVITLATMRAQWHPPPLAPVIMSA